MTNISTQDLPQQFKEFLRYSKTLGFTEPPKYDYLKVPWISASRYCVKLKTFPGAVPPMFRGPWILIQRSSTWLVVVVHSCKPVQGQPPGQRGELRGHRGRGRGWWPGRWSWWRCGRWRNFGEERMSPQTKQKLFYGDTGRLLDKYIDD